MLSVMAGDTVEISAQAFYNIDKTIPGQGVDIVPVVASAVAAMTSGGTSALGEGTQLAADLGTTASQSAALTQVQQKDNQGGEVKPESGINFVLYSSENLDIVKENTGVLMVDDKINSIQTLATDKMVMRQAGFLEIFVNNDAQTPVYYDNLRVAQTSGFVSEVNAYYPFGMLIGALSFQAAGDEYNAYKYSQKELQTEMSLNWGDHGARMADYIVGRWWVPDPLAEKYYNLSSYAYCANNPILFIDPDGRDWFVNDSTGDVIFIRGVSELSDEHRKKYGLKDFTYSNFGSDDIFGDVVSWYNNKNVLDAPYVGLFENSESFMNEQGYNKAEDVSVEEMKVTLYNQDTKKNNENKPTVREIELNRITYVEPDDLYSTYNEKMLRPVFFLGGKMEIYQYNVIRPYGKELTPMFLKTKNQYLLEIGKSIIKRLKH